MVNKNTIFSTIVILLCIGAFIYINDLDLESRFFPQVVSVILIILNVFHLIKYARIPDQAKMFGDTRFEKLIPMAIGMVVYVATMPFVGFIIASLLFMIFFMWFLHEGRKTDNAKVFLKSVILSCIVVSVFYGIFHYLFLIPLPVGRLFGA